MSGLINNQYGGGLLGMDNRRPVSPGYPSAVAIGDLKLTPQEQFLYEHHLNNLKNKRAVKNSDGSVSTIRNIGVSMDGKEVLIPTVWDGKILSAQDAIKRAGALGWNKWPAYATPEEADARYNQLHDIMAPDVEGY